jgi:mycothiol synthase
MQRDSKDQLITRLFRQDEDLPRLIHLRAEIEAAEKAGNDISEAAARATLNWPGHDPTQDRWVAETPDNPDWLIGHAWVRAQSKERTIIYAATHPDWRRRGVGSALLERALARAHEHGATHVTAAADVKNREADAFLCHNGFWPVGNNRFFCASAGIPLAEPNWPAGYAVRSYAEVQDLSTLVEVFNRSYNDMWGHRENTKGAMTEEYLAESMAKYPEWYIPEGIFIAFAPDGDVAGVCKALLGTGVEEPGEESRKIVDSPGVVPEHRDQKLQRPLTLTAMHWLRAHGPGPIELHTYGDKEKTVEIYRELGFVLEEHYKEYRRDLN